VTTQARITVAETPATLAEAAARLIVEAAREAVAARGRFTIALAGGATPRETYARLGHPPLRESMPWDRTWVFFGDERAVPPDHRESNYRMAHKALLSAVPLPLAQVFRMRAEMEDQEAAAAEYAEAMLKVFGTGPDELPRFDLVLLGLGIDGHTASLFPGSPALEERAQRALAVAGPNPPHRRMTITPPVIEGAREVLVLVSGASKAAALALALEGPVDPKAIPVQLARGGTWIVDAAAASALSRR